MSYSSCDFVDTILDALGIVVPEESQESPSDQADLALAAIKRLEAKAHACPQTVYTLAVDHHHGTTIRVFQSEQTALDGLARWVREWWPIECKAWPQEWPTPVEFDALSDGDAIRLYFDRMGERESYSLDSADLEN